MAESLAELQDQLIALNRARAKGIRSISVSGERSHVDNRLSLAIPNCARLKTTFNAELQPCGATAGRTIKIASSKGLDHHDER